MEGETVSGEGEMPTGILGKAMNCRREAEKTMLTTWLREKRGGQERITDKQKKGSREKEAFIYSEFPLSASKIKKKTS